MSAFALEHGAVYHTYSAYARGVDASSGVCTNGSTAPPKARNETGLCSAATTNTDKSFLPANDADERESTSSRGAVSP